MSWSVYGGTASTGNSSLFTAGKYDLAEDGTYYGYPDVPVGEFVSLLLRALQLARVQSTKAMEADSPPFNDVVDFPCFQTFT